MWGQGFLSVKEFLCDVACYFGCGTEKCRRLTPSHLEAGWYDNVDRFTGFSR